MNIFNAINEMPKYLFLSVLCLGLLSIPPSAIAWQDDGFDPFATDDSDIQDESFVSPDESEFDLGDSLSEGVKLVIRSLRESNPTTPMELARAIRSTLNVRQYEEAKRYVDQLIRLDLDGPALFDLSDEIGSDFFLDIRDQAEFQPAGRQFAQHVFETVRAEAYAPNRIDELIVELSDGNRFVRQEAFRRLRLLGAPAVAVMLQVCEDKNRRNEIPFVQSALKQMGEPAMFPLIGAARADGTIAQAVAIGSLSNIPSALALDPLLRASISSRVPDSVRAIAAEAVARRGLRSRVQIEEKIYERTNEYLDGKIALPKIGADQTEIWHWNFADKKMISTIESPAKAARIMAVDLARDLYQLSPSNRKYRQLQILTVLDATKRILGPNRVIRKNEVTQFVDELDTDELGEALEAAMKRGLQNGAIAAAELLGQHGDQRALMANGSGPCYLVRAILDGNRSLQFAAAKAIATIDPQTPYPGCSYVAKIITLMANTTGNAAAIAADSREESAQSLASLIFQSGRVGVTAHSSSQLIEMLETDPDIEFVLLTDSFARPHYRDLIQQLRNYWLTKNLPIGLLTRNVVNENASELIFDNDPLTIVMPITRNPKLVNRQIARLIELGSGLQISNVQRDLHTDFALHWINKTLAQPEVYGFYQLSNYRDQLEDVFNHPGARKLKSDLLVNLGTPLSQLILADSANDLSLTIDDRKYMADAFAKSVDRNGLLLNNIETRQQYDRYDARQRQGDSSEEILGTILDAIESRLVKRRGEFTKANR